MSIETELQIVVGETDNLTLHIHVVTGIIQLINAVHACIPGTSLSLKELVHIGFKGKSEQACEYIFEFIKDGLINLREGHMNQVVSGNYDWVWKITNSYLKNFGHPPIEPVPISL